MKNIDIIKIFQAHELPIIDESDETIGRTQFVVRYGSGFYSWGFHGKDNQEEDCLGVYFANGVNHYDDQDLLKNETELMQHIENYKLRKIREVIDGISEPNLKNRFKEQMKL